MFGLVHNIDFVLAACGILTVIFFGNREKYKSTSKANFSFYRIAYILIGGCVVEVILSFAQTYQDLVPYSFVLLNQALVNILRVLTALMIFQYLKAYDPDRTTENKYSIFEFTELGIVFVSAVINIVNMFTNIIYYVDAEGALIVGPLYHLNAALPVMAVIVALIYISPRRKFYTWYQYWAVFSFAGLVAVFSVAEIHIDMKASFFFFVATVGYLIMQFSLETPDYNKLVTALKNEEIATKEAKKFEENASKYKEVANEAKIAAEASFQEAEDARELAEMAVKRAEEAEETAKRALAVKNEFLKRVTLELRTPLNAVLGLSEIIENKSSEKEIKDYAKDTRKASQNLLDTINDILDFSKLESGKLKLNEDEYDLRNIISDVHHMIQFRAKERNIKVVFDIDEEIPYRLIGDEDRIRQILNNLLTNALKYTEVGLITLKISLAGKGRASVMLKFVVKDTGKGIKDEDLARLYDDFEKIDDDTNSYEGSGLGLTIVSRLLTMMGSKIMVESVFGLGSSFSFSLRQSVCDFATIGSFSPEKADIPEKKERELYFNPGATVLVIDDNFINHKIMKGLLKETQINVETASSGKEALSMTIGKKYDLIFVDFLMPAMDGVETCESIKKQAGGMNHNTPIVVLTASSGLAKEEYIRQGFSAALVKPIAIKDLNEVLWNTISD